MHAPAAQEAADAVTRLVAAGEVHGGTLRVFGDWFGRPNDNHHSPVSAEAVGSVLTVRFDGGETLRVWEPEDVTVTPSRLLVRRAARVRWEWYSYGRERSPENLLVREHRVEGGEVHATTTATRVWSSFAPSLSRPAVELV